MPLLFTLLFAGVQGAMFYHARTVAIAAAQEGARAAAAQNGTAHDGHAAAAAFLAQVGEDTLRGATITADRTATAATVHVVGSTLSVVPGWTPRINQSASMPIERLTG